MHILKCMAQVRLQGRQHITMAGVCMHVQQDVQGQPRLPATDNAVDEPPCNKVLLMGLAQHSLSTLQVEHAV